MARRPGRRSCKRPSTHARGAGRGAAGVRDARRAHGGHGARGAGPGHAGAAGSAARRVDQGSESPEALRAELSRKRVRACGSSAAGAVGAKEGTLGSPRPLRKTGSRCVGTPKLTLLRRGRRPPAPPGAGPQRGGRGLQDHRGRAPRPEEHAQPRARAALAEGFLLIEVTEAHAQPVPALRLAAAHLRAAEAMATARGRRQQSATAPAASRPPQPRRIATAPKPAPRARSSGAHEQLKLELDQQQVSHLI